MGTGIQVQVYGYTGIQVNNCTTCLDSDKMKSDQAEGIINVKKREYISMKTCADGKDGQTDRKL